MALELNNQSLLGLVHTYDSGGQLPAPGVMIGTEDINVGLAPDNDPADFGLDIFANVGNGVGPQVDGDGLGAYLDLDTNTEGDSVFVGAVDDSDAGNGGDIAVLGDAGQTADDGFLAVHLSGTGEHAADGSGSAADNTVAGVTGTSLFDVDDNVGGVGLIDLDNA